ncbi:MAG: chloride channel protein [Muribaculaceae bacterium]|nr:chloride channel protein [Muribaculaceae bacterium]
MNSSAIVNRAMAMLRWIGMHLPAQGYLYTTAFFIGVALGVLSWLLKWLIHLVTTLILPHGLPTSGPDYLLLLTPVAGIMLTGIFVRYILRDNIEHGISRIVVRTHDNNPTMSPRLCFGAIIGSTLTLGMGGSAGTEGPIAYTGAAVGSNIGRLMRVPRDMMTAMLGIGAAAGTAGIFKAPIGGMIFTFEVLKMSLSTPLIVATLISCVTSSLVAYWMSGYTYDIQWVNAELFDPHIIPGIIVLGVACGLYATYFSTVMTKMGDRYASIPNPWLRNLASGLMLAAMVFMFPSLYGEGFMMMTEMINGQTDVFLDGCMIALRGDTAMTVLVGAGVFLLLKSWAACASNSGGGVAGDFAPTFFAGAMMGLFVVTAANTWFHTNYSPAVMIIVGMAAVMGGVIRAPLTAIFLTMEMTSSYNIFLPIVIGVTISWGIVKLLTPRAFYDIAESRARNSAIDRSNAAATTAPATTTPPPDGGSGVV